MITGINGLVRKIERAMVMLEDISANGQKLSELIMGTFEGIKVINPFFFLLPSISCCLDALFVLTLISEVPGTSIYLQFPRSGSCFLLPPFLD